MSEGADPRVDAALQRADELAESTPEQHVAVYEDVHNTLQQVLAEASGPVPEEPRSDPGAASGTAADPQLRSSTPEAGGDAQT